MEGPLALQLVGPPELYWIPFRVVTSELWGASEATSFVMAGENDCWTSWVGLNGNGIVTRGNAAMSTGMTILWLISLEPRVYLNCKHKRSGSRASPKTARRRGC